MFSKGETSGVVGAVGFQLPPVPLSSPFFCVTMEDLASSFLRGAKKRDQNPLNGLQVKKEGNEGDSTHTGEHKMFLNGYVCLCLHGSDSDPLLSLAILL